MWKPLVICPHPATASQVGRALDELGFPGITLSSYPGLGSILALRAQHGTDICFIDVATNQETGLTLIGEAAGSGHVVALHSTKDADLILRCLRRGACEFLSDSSRGSLSALFERLRPARSSLPQRRPGKIYCVAPGKPGCGASTLAAHLAVELHGRTGTRVLLADTDSLTASISFMLKLKSEFHLDDVVRDWKRMDQDLWSRLTTPFSGIDVLLAPENPAARIEIGKTLGTELAAFWREHYDAAVIDCADARASADSGFAAVSDSLLLVTTNELAALHATRRSIEFLDQAAPGREKLRLIVNRYTPVTGLKREDLRAALEVEPFAVLSNDYDSIQTALLEGKPAPAGSRIRASIRHLVAQLEGHSPEKKSAGWFRLWSARRHAAS